MAKLQNVKATENSFISVQTWKINLNTMRKRVITKEHRKKDVLSLPGGPSSLSFSGVFEGTWWNLWGPDPWSQLTHSPSEEETKQREREKKKSVIFQFWELMISLVKWTADNHSASLHGDAGLSKRPLPFVGLSWTSYYEPAVW